MKDELTDQSNSLIAQIVSKQKIGITSIRVTLLGGSLVCILPSSLDSGFQILQLFACPVYPELGLLKRAHKEALRAANAKDEDRLLFSL
jgi:hypothetical protein